MKSLSEFPAPVIEKQSATFLTRFPLNKTRQTKRTKGQIAGPWLVSWCWYCSPIGWNWNHDAESWNRRRWIGSRDWANTCTDTWYSCHTSSQLYLIHKANNQDLRRRFSEGIFSNSASKKVWRFKKSWKKISAKLPLIYKKWMSYTILGRAKGFCFM